MSTYQYQAKGSDLWPIEPDSEAAFLPSLPEEDTIDKILKHYRVRYGMLIEEFATMDDAEYSTEAEKIIESAKQAIEDYLLKRERELLNGISSHSWSIAMRADGTNEVSVVNLNVIEAELANLEGEDKNGKV